MNVLTSRMTQTGRAVSPNWVFETLYRDGITGAHDPQEPAMAASIAFALIWQLVGARLLVPVCRGEQSLRQALDTIGAP